jgi:hypothetical protein
MHGFNTISKLPGEVERVDFESLNKQKFSIFCILY